jgi:hypothetical protein
VTEIHMPEPEEFDLEAWLSTGTIGHATVDTYADVVAGQTLIDLQDRRDELCKKLGIDPDEEPAAAAFPKDQPLSEYDGADDELADLDDQIEEMRQRLAASKMTWHLRAISAEEIDAAHDKHEIPQPPVDPGPNASEQAKTRFGKKAMAYGRARTEYDLSVRLEIIATAAESVATAAGSRSVDAALLRKLRARPHGQQWIDRLYKAVEQALKEEVELDRPTSPGFSTSTRG